MRKLRTCNILGINFAVADIRNAVKAVLSDLKGLSGKYICFANVHATVMANEDAQYMRVQNGAAYVFADGAPIAFLQRSRSIQKAKRVAGPDFMEEVLKRTADGQASHFFYGSSEEALKNLEKKLTVKYPRLNIKGMISPPYRELDEDEDAEYVRKINEAGADIVWISLGAPKQEKWMAAHEGRISGLMIGVGAAFDFHAGMVKRAPKWVQKIGMEWFYRLLQDPGRLLRRYLITNPKFLWLLLRLDTLTKSTKSNRIIMKRDTYPQSG